MFVSGVSGGGEWVGERTNSHGGVLEQVSELSAK